MSDTLDATIVDLIRGGGENKTADGSKTLRVLSFQENPRVILEVSLFFVKH